MHGALRAVQSVALGGDLGHNALDEVLLALAGNGQTQTLADLLQGSPVQCGQHPLSSHEPKLLLHFRQICIQPRQL
jgi:hypothetical protein